jgi:DNA-binding beta-propeller fold protein YncE
MTTRVSSVLLLFVFSAAGVASAADITGPLMGAVLDPPSGGVRLILGVPGAATLGAPVPLGIDASRAALSANLDYVLAAAADDGRMVLIRNLSGAPTPAMPLEAAPSADRIVLSPDGSSAALLYASRSRVNVITGLPDFPTLGAELDLSGLPEAPSSIAISDGGQSVAAVAGDNVVAFRSDGRSNTVAIAKRAVVAFLHGSSDLVFTDSDSSSVFLIRDINGTAGLTFVARDPDGVSSPSAVQISRDNRTLIVANSGSGVVARFSLNGRDLIMTACDCPISGLEALRANAAFLLNKPGSGPLWSFDADGPNGGVRFIPAPVAAPAEGGQQ